jgi:hypothetical protein
MNKILPIFSVLFLSSCASISTNVSKHDVTKPRAGLLIYRVPNTDAGFMSLYFGDKDQYYFKLNRKQYIYLEMDAGQYSFHAGSYGSLGVQKLDVTLEKGKTTCITALPSKTARLTIVSNFSPNFKIYEGRCPSDKYMNFYSAVTKVWNHLKNPLSAWHQKSERPEFDILRYQNFLNE